MGDTEVTVGPAAYVKWSAATMALVPPDGVVTLTSTTPVPAGLVAVIVVSLVTVKLAAAAPKLTAVAPVKAEPPIVTGVPPASGPLLGVTELTAGAGGGAI